MGSIGRPGGAGPGRCPKCGHEGELTKVTQTDGTEILRCYSCARSVRPQ